VEKERASLVSMNMRLQQQSVEKDDMNAKSLSTILHLKQLSEKLEEEKEALERNLKSAQQLALAARLAANAKARVEEEAMKEKDVAYEEVEHLKLSLAALRKEKDALGGQLAIAVSKVDTSMSEMSDIKNRCDELVALAAEKDEEMQKLEEALVVAKKDAIDAAQKAAVAEAQSKCSLGSGGSISKFETVFTAEELTIQVNQLKSRLVCPVCNTRDKKVIITRCRHMFCRNCVAATYEGRNRKCPSCGIRFDKKDVEDVWF
jgi:E3 ubiquitin-protein ligase BRE1